MDIPAPSFFLGDSSNLSKQLHSLFPQFNLPLFLGKFRCDAVVKFADGVKIQMDVACRPQDWAGADRFGGVIGVA